MAIPQNLPKSLTGPFFENGLLRFIDGPDGKPLIQSAITGITYPATLDRIGYSSRTGWKNSNRRNDSINWISN